ncbi:MAG: purine-binding chemotaxis protein CheW [Bradymonadia bacterium]|jgi:purine-binding chemotaxis protein CheW
MEQTTRPLFVFQLGDITLSVDATAVEAVTHWRSATPLPHLPGHYRGLINHDQSALIVLDLHRFLTLDSDESTQPTGIVVVHSGDLRAGVPVQRSLGITHIDGDSLEPPSSMRSGKLGEFLSGQWEYNETPCGLLSIDQLLEAARV